MQKQWIAGAIAALSLSAQAHAANSDIAGICAVYNADERSLSVDVRTRCLSSGSREITDTLALNVDQNSASIQILGELTATYGSMIGSADCMGSFTKQLSATDVDERRYSVSLAGQALGHLDLIAGQSQKACFKARGRGTRATAIGDKNFSEWSSSTRLPWADWRGSDVPSLIAPLLSGFPESAETAPSVEISLRRGFWLPSAVRKPFGFARQGEEVMLVEITEMGLADDSVSAQRFYGIAKQGDDGWQLIRLFRQSMCARGNSAGQWTSDLCP